MSGNSFPCVESWFAVAIIRIIMVSLVILVQAVVAERYLSGYAISTQSYFVPTSVNDCINSCLKSTRCVAVSYCAWPNGANCYIPTCYNLNLLPLSFCFTIIFTEKTYSVNGNLPTALFDSTLTDTCSSTSSFSQFPSTSTYSPAASLFAGNALTSASLALGYQLSQVPITSAFTSFYWIKLNDISQAVTLLSVTYTISGSSSIVIRFIYASGVLQFSHNIAGCSQACTVSSVTSLTPNQWHSIALIYNPSALLVQAYFDLSLVLNGTLTSAPTQASSSSTFSIGTFNAAIHCHKLYNSVLSSNSLNNVASSCLLGTITYLSTTDYSVLPANQFGTVVVSGQRVMVFCSGSKVNWGQARSQCENLGMNLAILSDSNVRNAFSYLVNQLSQCDYLHVGAKYVYFGFLSSKNGYYWYAYPNNKVYPNKDCSIFSDCDYVRWRDDQDDFDDEDDNDSAYYGCTVAV